MKKITLILFLLFFKTTFSQTILDEYPEGQSPYKNGLVDLFSDMQNYFVSNNLKSCSNFEMVWVTLKIDETGRPFLIKKKSNEKSIDQNKCAFELATKALGSLKNWQPAEIKGKKVTAYFEFAFIPNDFFENYKPDYGITTTISLPQFPGGMDAFKAKLSKNIHGYLDWTTINSEIKFIFYFDIDSKGKLSNVEVESKIPNSEYLHEDVAYSVKRIKDKWKPALLDNEPIKYRYKFYYTLDVFYVD